MIRAAFVCNHVAAGEPIWLLELGDSEGQLPPHLDACCRECADKDELGVDDLKVIHATHLQEQVMAMLHYEAS